MDISGSDLADQLLNLLGGGALALGDHLATNILGNGGGAVQAQEEGGLELLLGTLNLGSGDRGGQTGPLLLGKVDQVILAVLVLSDEVDTEQTSVSVGGVEGHERVGQLALVDNAGQAGGGVGRGAEGAVPGANDRLHHEHGIVVGGGPAASLNSDGNVGLSHGVVLETDLRAGKVGGEGVGLAQTSRVGRDGELGKVLLGQGNQGIVINTTGTNKDHAVSGVVGLDVVGEVIAGQGLDVLLGSQDGAAKSLTLESSGVQVVKDNLLHLLVNLLLLAENDIALALNGIVVQGRVLENVGKNLNRLGDVGLEGLGVVDSLLAGSVGVQVGTHVLDLDLNVVLTTGVGTLDLRKRWNASQSLVFALVVASFQ